MSDTITIQGTKVAGGLWVTLVGRNGAGHMGDVHMIPYNGGTISFKPVVEAPWRVSVSKPGSMGSVQGHLDNVGPGETVCVNESAKTVTYQVVVVDVSLGSCPKG